jgi:diguanylate cyclase
MQDKPGKPDQQSPAEIARETFRRLAARRMAPTPDAYREIYDEIAGIKEQSAAEKALTEFAASLAGGPEHIAAHAHQVINALRVRDWQKCSKQLAQLADNFMAPAPADVAASSTVAQTDKPDVVERPDVSAIRKESIPLVDPPEPRVVKTSIPLVDDPEPVQSRTASIALGDPDMPQVALDPKLVAEEVQLEVFGPPHSKLLREMLVRTWSLAVASLLQRAPEFAKDAEAIAEEIRQARSEKALTEISARLKQLCFQIEMKSGDLEEEHELLLRLFKLLFENIGDLVEDDTWLAGQVARVRELLAGPVDHVTLIDVSRNLKDVIYKQNLLKHSLQEAKGTLKNMMLTFVDRLDAIAASTGGYQEKITKYSVQISASKDITDLNKILDHVMFDTRVAQTDALRSREQIESARIEVQTAENRVHQLESELVQMSELAREDQLTGSLNRRGLDEVLEREMARSERKKSPLCVALLDLDDFKKLNDTHGHSAGDGALIHLVKVIKDTLRSMDVIARFGGEEFLIVLPDTPQDVAMQTVTRVQRELTKQIFMYENQRVLITFSAGVALRTASEDQATLIARADEALYKAKKAGKNRAVKAE